MVQTSVACSGVVIVILFFACTCMVVSGSGNSWTSRKLLGNENDVYAIKQMSNASMTRVIGIDPLLTAKSIEVAAFNGEHVVFIGDSISRYHYLSFVYNIRHGHALSEVMHPSLVCERQWKTWQTFYSGTTGALYPERCDCYREQGPNITRICENRYYTDLHRKISVTYYQSFGSNYTVHGHWSARPSLPAGASNAELVAPLTRYTPPSWEVDLRELYAAQISFLEPKPTILVLNTGWWPNTFDNETYAREVIDRLYPHVDLLIWRTVTANVTGSLEHGAAADRMVCSFKEVVCMDVSWTANLTAAAWWDTKHFYAHVYHRMNLQLEAVIKRERGRKR